jgi:indole-3-glycerol phosphate synthase
MNILDKIVVQKIHEVEKNRALLKIVDLEEGVFFKRNCISLAKRLKQPGNSGIIAEIKRKSPSKGEIHPILDVVEVAKGYAEAGASGISILTDKTFFGGRGEDLVEVREQLHLPILRKDFIVDEYQIAEAKAMGADVILLIAAVLAPWEIFRFSSIAESLGLEVLLEVHNERELEASLSQNPHIQMIGVNNRDLTSFEVKLETSFSLAEKIPDRYVKVAESGINNPNTVRQLKEAGFQGFLIGEHFMKHAEPHRACKDFIEKL